MPIYHKTTSTGNPNTAEIDYHNSEAAKVKRTREQAYFNSYDFDAIEVLPYESDKDDEDDDGYRKHTKLSNHYTRNRDVTLKVELEQGITKSRRNAKISHPAHHQQQQQQQQQQKPLSHSYKNSSTSKDSFILDTCHCQQREQKQQQQHNPHKPTAYLKRIADLFHHKPVNNSLNNDLKSVTTETLNSNREMMAESVKHLKNSSSKTSSTTSTTTPSSAAIVKGNCNGIRTVVGNTIASRDREQDRDAPYDYVMDETKQLSCSGEKIISNAKSVNNSEEAGKCAAKSCVVAASGVVNGDGNFLLPRAMLKYQSSNVMPSGAVTTAATTAYSMPLPITNNNTEFKQQQQQQQQHHQPVIDPDSLDEVQENNSNKLTSDGVSGIEGGVTADPLKLKKNSISSSLNSSMSFEELEAVEVEENHYEAKKLKDEPKVLPKTCCINMKSSARSSSHQSHYSTDKSASSGYYSSNVCSTYSLEEHIYSEPTIDLKKLKHQPLKESVCQRNVPQAISSATTLKASNTLKHKQLLQQPHQPQQTSLTCKPNSVMRTLDYTRRYGYAVNDDLVCKSSNSQILPVKHKSQEFNENLKILESSIENLDRHLKTFPGLNSQEVYSLQDKQRHLPTIQEAFDSLKKPTSWTEDRSDDSLMDIDLDSFLLDKDKVKQEKTSRVKGLVNPTFLPEEQEENHYKCAKYINSCPEDAYRVDSDILAPAHSSISGQSLAVSVDLYPKRYEEQLHFENTRELLEDVRDKIRLLTQSQEEVGTHKLTTTTTQPSKEDYIPQELHTMINTLKRELELYLERMNQHSELEIRQLCSGLVKNQNIVKMKNAFERRRSLTETNDVYASYEALKDGIVLKNQGMPISIRQQQITSIRCTSDPNFKMKRKSITEVFPMAECYVESIQTDKAKDTPPAAQTPSTTQLQKNLSFHKPVLEQLSSDSVATNNHKSHKTSSSGDNSDTNDKESILDWHRKKPSIWEMYYGTNRIQQSLLGVKKNGMMLTTTGTSSPSTMCYPSSRPESDFTLDLPRAEQLRIKMEKEKKFRQRCRLITTFLSLVFFLLTVMVVSLVLTRGKRMFGSMI